MSWVLAPSLPPPAKILLAPLVRGLIEALAKSAPGCWGGAAWGGEDSAEAGWIPNLRGGWVLPRCAADMVLAIEGGGPGGAKANLTSIKFEPKTATE